MLRNSYFRAVTHLKRSQFRGFLKFSLLHLLVVVMLLPCAILGAWVVYRDQFVRQRRIIDKLAHMVRCDDPDLKVSELMTTDICPGACDIASWGGHLRFRLEEDRNWAAKLYTPGEIAQVVAVEIRDPNYS